MMNSVWLSAGAPLWKTLLHLNGMEKNGQIEGAGHESIASIFANDVWSTATEQIWANI